MTQNHTAGPLGRPDADHLVLVPGACCTPLLWADQIDGLRDLAPSITVLDNRRHRSMARLVSHYLPRLPARFAVAGLSQGGLIALEFLRQAPERITRLALLDTMARPEPSAAARRHRLAILLARTAPLALLDRIMWPKMVAPHHLGDDQLHAILRRMIVDTGRSGIVNQQRMFLSRPDYRPILPFIAIPTMVVVGEYDTFTPRSAAEEMARLIPESHLAVVPDAGHLSSIEAPEAVTALLRRWLS